MADTSSDKGSPNRTTVIQHEGSCCLMTPSRPRLNGRSLPGRQIDRRHKNIDENTHPFSIPGRVVHTGYVISYFTGNIIDGQQQWLRATIQQMTKKLQHKHPSYYNILNELGEELSIQLYHNLTKPLFNKSKSNRL